MLAMYCKSLLKMHSDWIKLVLRIFYTMPEGVEYIRKLITLLLATQKAKFKMHIASHGFQRILSICGPLNNKNQLFFQIPFYCSSLFFSN